MDRSAVTQRIWTLTEPVVLSHGLEVVDIQFRPEGGRMVLRFLIDRPTGGVTLDELARLSREVGDVLDGHDAVPGRYQLECSSPGLNRPLVRAAHFERVVGQRVHVKTREPIGGRRQFRGVLSSATAEGIEIHDPAVGMVRMSFDAIEKANVEYDFSRPIGQSHAPA